MAFRELRPKTTEEQAASWVKCKLTVNGRLLTYDETCQWIRDMEDLRSRKLALAGRVEPEIEDEV